MRGTALWRLRQEGFDDEKSPRATTFLPKKSQCQNFEWAIYTLFASFWNPKQKGRRSRYR